MKDISNIQRIVNVIRDAQSIIKKQPHNISGEPKRIKPPYNIITHPQQSEPKRFPKRFETFPPSEIIPPPFPRNRTPPRFRTFQLPEVITPPFPRKQSEQLFESWDTQSSRMSLKYKKIF